LINAGLKRTPSATPKLLKGNMMIRVPALLTRMTLAFSILTSAAAPLAAAPLPAPFSGASSTDVIMIGQRERFERRGNIAFLNGNRGYRNQRRGFREYNGFWFPASAFLGAIIIGEILNGPRMIRRDGSHVRWCADRYRSYRASSNSYQPYNGPRRICYSPYN
jgi:BA14K-like protein